MIAVYLLDLDLGHLADAFVQLTYSNSYTDGGGFHTRCRPAHQEQFGVQYLAQGHFGMQGEWNQL